VKKLAGLGEPDLAEIAKGERALHEFGQVLEAHLHGRRWLLGDPLTIADFAVGAPLAMAEAGQYPLAQYPEITRWYGTLSALPAWRKAMIPPLA
jgi:glutathione S-transferase